MIDQLQPARLWALLGRHRPFAVLVGAGVLLRIITMLGYPPAMWFNDSFDYLHAALAFYPHPVRPDGYSFFLLALEPFHSFALVVGIQHLMGVAMAFMVYLPLRRFGLPGWGAALAASPVLLDAYQIQLEQLILSDVPFAFLIMLAITLLMGRARPSLRTAGVVGLLVGMAVLTRSVGLPVLLAVVAYMLVRTMNWRMIATTVVVCTLPMAGYAVWFHSTWGKFSMTGSSGIFLYARTTRFVDCNKIKNLPAEEIPLCPATPPKYSQDSIWTRDSPLHRSSTNRFDARLDRLGSDFAKRAIMAQPGDYLKIVGQDFLRTFQWNRTTFPDAKTYRQYEFATKPAPLPAWPMGSGRTAAQEAAHYEQGNARGRVVEPFAWFMRLYQRHVFLPGTLVGLILLVGLAGMVPMWRRRGDGTLLGLGWGGRAVLPWITATGLLLAPASTAEFDYRYILPIVPIACLAAGLAFTAEPRAAFSAAWERFRRRRKDPGPGPDPEPARRPVPEAATRS